jgi:hypothetical protein
MIFMHHSFNRYTAHFFLCILFTTIIACVVVAQNSEQTEAETNVPILKQTTTRGHWSTRDANGVISEESFKEFLTQKENAFLKELNVDFSTQTLISVTVRGDCHVRASVNITRDDEAKKYLCKVTKIYGGCRAAGRIQKWFVIEKLRPEYTIEFTEMKAEKDW